MVTQISALHMSTGSRAPLLASTSASSLPWDRIDSNPFLHNPLATSSHVSGSKNRSWRCFLPTLRTLMFAYFEKMEWICHKRYIARPVKPRHTWTSAKKASMRSATSAKTTGGEKCHVSKKQWQLKGPHLTFWRVKAGAKPWPPVPPAPLSLTTQRPSRFAALKALLRGYPPSAAPSRGLVP